MSINDRSLDGMLDRLVLVASGYGALMHMKGEGCCGGKDAFTNQKNRIN